MLLKEENEDAVREGLYEIFGGEDDYKSWAHETARNIIQSLEGDPEEEYESVDIAGLADSMFDEFMDAYLPHNMPELNEVQYAFTRKAIRKEIENEVK